MVISYQDLTSGSSQPLSQCHSLDIVEEEAALVGLGLEPTGTGVVGVVRVVQYASGDSDVPSVLDAPPSMAKPLAKQSQLLALTPLQNMPVSRLSWVPNH